MAGKPQILLHNPTNYPWVRTAWLTSSEIQYYIIQEMCHEQDEESDAPEQHRGDASRMMHLDCIVAMHHVWCTWTVSWRCITHDAPGLYRGDASRMMHLNCIVAMHHAWCTCRLHRGDTLRMMHIESIVMKSLIIKLWVLVLWHQLFICIIMCDNLRQRIHFL